MNYSGQIRCGVALGAMIIGLTAGAAHAQDAGTPAPQAADPAPQTADGSAPAEIVVTGVRASIASAADRKRTASQIVDSIVAEDIGKLPDNNATEALQRITGVQVSRDVGEGSSIAIRGLPQVETTLNGRETFTAGGGRTFNLQDLPAELISRIDVYKSPSPDLIEGGLGGLVDIRTRRPLDLPGFSASATLRNFYGDLIGKSKPSASVLLSDRWHTGIGEMGAMISVSYQLRPYRQDLDSTGAPGSRLNVIAGQQVFAPNGNNQVLITGERERIGANAAFQWRPAPNLEFLIEGQYQRFKATQQQYNALFQSAGTAVVPGSATTFPGTQDISQVTYANQSLTAGSTERDFADENRSISLNGKWTSGQFTLTADGTYTKSTNDLWYTELDLITTVPTITQQLGTNPPSSSTGAYDLSDLSKYKVGNLTRNENHYSGHEAAAQLDGEYKVDSWLSSIKFGVRYSDRTIAQNNPLRYTGKTPNTNPAAYPGLFQANGYGDFYDKTAAGLDFQRNYPYAVVGQLANNFQGVLSQLGLTGALAPSVTSVNSQLAAFNADESVWAGYAMASLKFGPVDGNIGVRYVRTKDTIVGNQLKTTTLPGGGLTPVVPNVVEPVSVHNSYDDWLPSANFRIHLTDKLQLRLAASKTLTRPDFSQLSPALTVVPGQLAASQGNPNLSPIKANNADISLEWYFNKTGSVYAAGFYKDVQGFIFTRQTTGVTIGGLTGYTLSAPENSGDGKVKGFEVGYQQFFDFLPGFLSGLGMQANFTYADSKAPTSLVGFSAPLTQLSKTSYNIVGIYEKNGVSLRVAYNYRSKFLSSILGGAYTDAAGGLHTFTWPVYTKGYGWLDASFNIDVTKHFTLSFDAQNLLRTQIQQYYQVQTRPGQFTIDDRQFMIGVRLKY